MAAALARFTINGVFERVVVVNLDRRPDRWNSVADQAARHGIVIERFPAVDGRDPGVEREWREYAARPLVPPPDSRPVREPFQFYLDYDNQAARVAYLETRDNQKAIRTAGAWAYLKSMAAILEAAIEQRLESLLVLDDDALFHRETAALFNRAMRQAPADWLILQLGTLQYQWEDWWIKWHSENLYLCRGSSIGSHAVGMRREAMPLLLDHVRRFDLPYDIGALSAVKHAFPERCLTMFPNVVIQSSMGSDIGSSNAQPLELDRPDNRYRWSLDEYGPATVR